VIRTDDYLKIQQFEIPTTPHLETSTSEKTERDPHELKPTKAKLGVPVGAGDILSLTVYGRPDMSGDLTVRGDGSIFIPLIGDVNVAKKSASEIQSILTKRFQGFIKNASVGVYLKESKSAMFSVLGAVRKPGRFQWERPMSVYEAIAFANGFENSSVTSRAFIIRDDKKIPINLDYLMSPSKPVEALDVIPGDVVVVPSHNELFVAVLGRVANPGLIPIRGTDMKLAQALALAGGAKRGAKLDQVRILRASGEKTFQLLTVNMERMLTKGIPPMLPGLDIRPGDVVYIPQTGISNFAEALQEITPILQVLALPLGITTDVLLLKELL